MISEKSLQALRGYQQKEAEGPLPPTTIPTAAASVLWEMTKKGPALAWGGLKEIVSGGKAVAPYLLALPVVLAMGGGYAASKLTSPSEETEAAAQSELLKAEQERSAMELERLAQASKAQAAKTPLAKPRTLRI